jgi:hypothetical protein
MTTSYDKPFGGPVRYLVGAEFDAAKKRIEERDGTAWPTKRAARINWEQIERERHGAIRKEHDREAAKVKRELLGILV